MKTVRSDFEKLFKQSADEFIESFKKLVQIPSVNGHTTYQAPFGIGPKRALEYVLKLSKELGFRTSQVADCVGWAEYGPIDGEYFGILGHLDVVDVEDDWNYPPFELTVDDGYFYGRGVLDNKGPILSTLFALYLIKKQGTPLKKRIRIMFGTDEESGSRDIPKYLQSEKPPYAGFTPDCKFPVVYGERGLLDLTVSTTITDGSLKQIDAIEGVFDHSFLPDSAAITVLGKKMEFHGTKAPSNAPDMADNVLPKLVNECVELNGQTGKVFLWLDQRISDQSNGKNLDLDFSDEISGELQLSFYEIQKKDNELSFSISIRYPVTISEKQVIDRFSSKLLYNMKLRVNRRYASVTKNKKLKYIKNFSKIYTNDTDLNGDAVTTTGVTYARVMPNIVAFGPSFPGQKGIAHKGNEWLKYSDWLMMTEIYYDCLIDELC